MGGLFESNLHLVSNLRNIFPLLNLFGAGGGGRLKQPLLSVFYWSPKNGKMVTSVDRRNFVSVACSATKSKLCPFSFLNFPVMYLRTVEKQKRDTKNCLFQVSPASGSPNWDKIRLSWNGVAHIGTEGFGFIWCTPNQDNLNLTWYVREQLPLYMVWKYWHCQDELIPPPPTIKVSTNAKRDNLM